MSRLTSVIPVLVCLAGSLTPGVSSADEGPPGVRSVYQLRSSVVGMGGSPTASATLRMNGTAAQGSPIGIVAGGSRLLYSGFWGSIMLLSSGIEPVVPAGWRNALFLNRPNPFHTATWITYSIAREGPVALRIYDASGRTVRTLVDGRAEPGVHQIVWDGRDESGAAVASGIYFYRIASGDFISSRKTMLIR